MTSGSFTIAPIMFSAFGHATSSTMTLWVPNRDIPYQGSDKCLVRISKKNLQQAGLDPSQKRLSKKKIKLDYIILAWPRFGCPVSKPKPPSFPSSLLPVALSLSLSLSLLPLFLSLPLTASFLIYLQPALHPFRPPFP